MSQNVIALCRVDGDELQFCTYSNTGVGGAIAISPGHSETVDPVDALNSSSDMQGDNL